MVGLTFQEVNDRLLSLKSQWADNLINDDEYINKTCELMSYEEIGELFREIVAENKRLKAQLAAVPVDAMLICIGQSDDYDFTAPMAVVEEFATWLESQRAQRQGKVQP